MSGGSFFAMLSRMKYINRWSLMRNTRQESLSEHTLETAIIAHALAVIRNRRFGGNVNAERVALLALFHDVSEIMTGDMPTPVKYHSDTLRQSYREVERLAAEHLASMLPEDLREEYSPLLSEQGSEEELRLVKAADKLSALIKCTEEHKAGNSEFDRAAETTRSSIEAMALPEAEVFMRDFLPAYSLTLDEQS